MGRQLPKHDDYLQKLEHYCEASDIIIEIKDYKHHGVYFPTRRAIVVDEDLDDTEQLATILHELGHVFDDVLNAPNTLEKYNRAYSDFYKNRATEQQVKLVMDCEQRAWDYGRGIAKKLRINLGKWYDVEEKEALKEYGQEEQSGS